MKSTAIDWNELNAIAKELSQATISPASITSIELSSIETALMNLLETKDWEGILQFEELFHHQISQETLSVHQLFRKVSQEAIQAARILNKKNKLADLLKMEGHNLHRLGFHKNALDTFLEAEQIYRTEQDLANAKDSLFMTTLCHRALRNFKDARRIAEQLLDESELNDPWRAHPLKLLAWLERDNKKFATAEKLLRESIELYSKISETDIFYADTLADLGEILGLQGSIENAKTYLQKSLDVARSYKGQYARQEARTLAKLAELTLSQGNYDEALEFLQKADDNIRGYGTYLDLLWKIEVIRAMIYFQTGQILEGFRKLRSALNLHKGLNLSLGDFISKIFSRLKIGTGSPRKQS